VGFDIGASLSASDSTSQGLTQDFRGAFGGPFIVGKGASGGLPSWIYAAVLGVAALGLTLWLVRR